MTRTTRILGLCLAVVVATPAVVFAQGDPVRFDALVGLARVRRDAGDLPAARGFFERARALRAFDVDLLDEYFWVLADVDPAAAAPIGERILALRPTEVGVRDRLISAAVSTGNEARAQALARAGEQLMPLAAIWPRRLGESLFREGQAADAAAALGRAVRSREATRDDRALHAVALESAGDPAGAVAAWGSDGPELCAPRPEWCTSRLRALAAAGEPVAAARDIERWLARYPDDRDMRSLLVETWARAGRPEDAIAALQPLKADPGAARWLRRELEFTQQIGDRTRIVAALQALDRAGAATREERWQLAEMLVERREYDRARGTIVTVARDSDPCDERPLRLLQHIPRDQASEDFLRVIGVRPPSCPGSAEWRGIAARRATAAGMLSHALELLEPVGAAGSLDADIEALYGQLLLWNGEPDRAAPVLDRAVQRGATADLAEARIAAWRATGRAPEAWRLAQQRLAAAPVAVETRVDWAGLAIDAGAPREALALIEPILDDSRVGARARAIAARALAAGGATDEALSAFAGLDPETLQPAEALAWLDLVEAHRGVPAALALSTQFAASGRAWVDVIARQAVWYALVGPAASFEERRAAVAAVSASRAALIDAEIALRRQRPAEATAALRPALDDPSGQVRLQATDLMSVALAGLGDWAGAIALLKPLMERRPGTLDYEVRLAEWRAQADRSPDAIARVVALAGEHPEHAGASAGAARVLVATERYAEALAILEARSSRTVEERILAAQCLRALERPRDALVQVEDLGHDPRAALMRASLAAAVRGPAAADDDFRRLAQAPDATTATFLAWTAAQTSARARASVLGEACRRFPDDADLATSRALALRDAGDAAGALVAADTALRLDPVRTEAWVVLVDATVATRGRDALQGALARFEQVATRDPALVSGLAQQLAGYARGSDDPMIARTLGWLDAARARDPGRPDIALARARVLMAAERWNESLAITDAVIAAPAAAPSHVTTALRLRAEALAYRGDHAAAIAAFDEYLAVAPDDVGAARLQARVAGWGRRFDESRERYRALVARYPDEAVIGAEAGAKAAFYDGRWRDAARQYRRWLDLEPANREAAFELAQSMQADGDARGALALYRTLSDGPRAHRVGADARARVEQQQGPSVAPYGSAVSSNGYGGQRLLDWTEAGASVTFAAGPGQRARLAAEGGAVGVRSPGWRRDGFQAGLAVEFAPLGRWLFDARARVIDVGQAAGNAVEADLRASFLIVDRWRALVTAERALVAENAATVDANLLARGVSVGTAFEAPRASSLVRATWSSLSDGNTRRGVEASGGWTFLAGRSEWRATTWNQWTGFAEARAEYFSPSSFWRSDVGVEWRRWLAPMRFRGDRERYVSAGYALGFDDRGEIYHHPAVRFGYELASGLALEGRGDWLRSPVFDQTEAFIGVRFGGATVRVRQP
jgi:tetratricopeptide (TPR) repeat protein